MAPVELTVGGPAAGGGFVAHLPDGRVVFVRHAVEGERVLAELTEEHATWARADAVQVLDPSPARVVPPCPHAGPGQCGGCDYQHVDLVAQRAIKSRRLSEQLRAIAQLELEVPVAAVAPSPHGLGTRTRVRFAVDGEGHLAMRQNRRHDLVAVDRCRLAVAALDAIGLTERQLPAGAEVEAIALEGAVAPTVAVTTSPRARGRDRRPSRTEVLDGEGLAPEQSTDVGGRHYDVAAGVFWQVHLEGPALLCDEVLDGLALGAGDRVLDLYCGAGLFTSAIAASVGSTGSVVGIDASDEAIRDARRNVADWPWARVVAGRVQAGAVREVVAGCTHAVLDPPRRGADRGALDVLSATPSLRRLVSVSCDPSTFARDLRVLLDAGWHLERVRAFDLFEMTEHVECVAVLER
jgi:tRNA/tmRNA/rRNA uracil-C5-methylase (TrmA/RlmC/RlmD family)